ncbi:ABC transporter permease [Lentzea alba]|uniref:hypothetical protein n=1 Tax=Lentzea alba TaxID=2714351 RepID=UPI0039BF8070
MNTMLWLTWRQHRWTIAATAALALLGAYSLLSTEIGNARYDSMPIAGFYGLMVQLSFGAVIGMFWGAPLIARELEERTYFVAWGQDVTPAVWLRGKVLVLGGLAVVLGLAVGAGDGFSGAQKSWSQFEGSPLVQAGYAFLGFALGVLVGLLTRHVVTAIAATLVFYTLIRAVQAALMRDHYMPVERSIARWESTVDVPPSALEIARGFVGPDLDPVPLTDLCEGLPNPNSCMRASKTAIGTYVDYQPIDRLVIFQVVEFVICALIAAGLLFLTFRLLRRGGGWKPSRSHRRLESEESVEPVQSTPEVAAAQAEG